MGNYIAVPHHSSHATGRVILSDGRVYEFHRPITVAELMLEYPQEVVVEFHSDLTEKRPTPLPADKKLEVKKVYLMLPMKRGKPASLSSEEARHVLLTASSVLRSKSFLSSSRFLVPLIARLCPAGAGIGDEPRHFVAKNKECRVEKRPTVDEYGSEFSTEIFENRPEYLSRQLSGKGWKPSLDTIKEKRLEKIKISHWLF